MDNKFDRIRKHFPVAKHLVYLNHAAVSPVPDLVANQMRRQIEEQLSYGGRVEDRWEKRAEIARNEAARLLGASPSEIAFVANTSQGLNLFARGLRWRRGDNVVLPRVEFPANVYPWLSLQSKGVKIKFVEEKDGRIRIEDIERAIDSRTRVVAISFVEFSSGFRNDLGEVARICRSKGVYVVVDGIQGLGALKIDVKRAKIDALSAGGHKWLLAPQGTGIFYLRRELLDEIEHPMPGWMSVVNWQNYYDFDFTLFKDSRRYESAQKNLIGLCGLYGALSLINRLGIESIQVRIIELTDHLCTRLTEHGYCIFSPRGEKEKSGIVSFYPKRLKAEQIWAGLRRKKFITSARQGRVRISPHFYNTFDELDRLVDQVVEMEGK
ncbi:MAG: aminotransferase class V-fold PLP-dependent enzyme [bacterium]